MKYLLAALVCLIAPSCQAGEIRDRFSSSGGNPQDETIVYPVPEMPASHGISEIGIERTLCLGTCPAYTFIAKSDGTFRYVGEFYTEPIGVRTGKIPPWSFNLLARFIAESNYMDLANNYVVPATDHPSAYTMVVLNGQRKIVSNYGGAGPGVLWAIEQLIDDLKDQAEWN